MGLDELEGMDGPEDLRGKTTKKTDDTEQSTSFENPYTADKDGEEYWKEIYNKFGNGGGLNNQTLADICNHVHTSPWLVKKKLHQHGIVSVKEDQWRTDYPRRTFSLDKPSGGERLFTVDGDEEGEDSSDGLQSLIDSEL